MITDFITCVKNKQNIFGHQSTPIQTFKSTNMSKRWSRGMTLRREKHPAEHHAAPSQRGEDLLSAMAKCDV